MDRFNKSNILIVLIWLSSVCLFGQNHSNFRHLSVTYNNSHQFIYKTIEDELGHIWMLCEKGVLVYDGYEYVLINEKKIFPDGEENDVIKNFIKDKDGNIWFYSNFGLVTKYDVTNGIFKSEPFFNKDPIQIIRANRTTVWLITKSGIVYSYLNSKFESVVTIPIENSLSHNVIDIAFGNSNELFISTSKGKVFNYSLKPKQLTELIGSFTDFPGQIVLSVDNNNRLWLGTETYGLFVYDIAAKHFIQDQFFKTNKFNINKEMFMSLYHDSEGFVWGGTDGGGLYKINSNTGLIDLYVKQEFNKHSLSNNTILHISEDSNKNIWATTKYGDINILPNSSDYINFEEGSENRMPLSILKSSKGVLWIGTDGNGLLKLSDNLNGKQYFDKVYLNKGFHVQSIVEDRVFNIWFGTYKNGLWYHDTKKNTFKKVSIFNSKKQEATDVRTVFNDSKGRIWVGSNISINIYSTNLKLLVSFENNTMGLKGTILESITEDEKGVIWLGLEDGGLSRFNENRNTLKYSSFTNQSQFNTDIKNEVYSVKSMSFGKANQLWLINHQGKLFNYNTENNTYITQDYIEGINEGDFKAIIATDSTNIWISSSGGISHLNTNDSILKTYNGSEFFQGNIFLPRSVYKDDKGKLYFGGIKGVNYFNPNKLKEKPISATLNINAIEVLNQPIEFLIPSQVNSKISNIESLELEYNQSSFSFKFSAVDNVLNPKYYYAYRLNGFDKNWVTNQSGRKATYTNIPSGSYTFEVKAGTKKGLWNIPSKQVVIHIEQPIWNKPIAYFIYFLILGLIGLILKRWLTLKRNLFLEKVSHKKKNEIYDLKMNFFAKMSHEIQTPLTLILGPIDDMLIRAEQNGNLLLEQRLNIIANNSKRLSKIARELTLVRNKELNKLKLAVTKNNIFKDISEISVSFMELARKQKIDFTVNCPKNLQETWYDKDKIEHIIYNLLSNAFKFTPKEGNVQLSIIPNNSKKQIKITVADSGQGIPKKELEHIFDLFYQSNTSKNNIGMGIGLSLTKELVDLHKGKIKVSSTETDGTIFTIKLPIKEQAYTEEEKIITSTFEDSGSISENLDYNQKVIADVNILKKTILIVEDNLDLQSFLKDLFSIKYNILLADNGEEGYHYAKNSLPDLILSDIMMPKLDGIEMCQELQKNNLTKHIPIILLTAKNSTNSKIAGLKSGAIEYINKPFNTKELLLKVENIILSNERNISKYRKEVISNPEIKLEKTNDEAFLDKLTTIIDSKMNDASFKIEHLADSLNMSYSSLYRKCQSLTGMNLVDFIRKLRLKKSIVLILKYGYTISEAAFAVGFNSPKYFSKSFKKVYGKSPKEFKLEAQKEGVDNYLVKHKIENTFLNTIKTE